MSSDYAIDPATGDIVYVEGDVVTSAGIENLLYLTIVIERGTYWADADLGSDVVALLRAGEQWPVIVDAARRGIEALQQRGLLTLLGVSHDPDTRELVIDVEEMSEPYRLEVPS